MFGILITALILCMSMVNNVQCQQAEKDSSNAILGYFEKKCTNTNTFHNVTIEASGFSSYLEHAFTYATEENRKHFCEVEKPYLSKRLKGIAGTLKTCLTPNDMFFAGFIPESFDEFLNFLCHKYGENIVWFYNPESKECRMRMPDSVVNDCMNKIIGPTLHDVTKTQLCRDMSIVRDCFTRHIVSVCPEKGLMHELNKRLFHYIMKPCSNTNSAVSQTTISFVSLVISLFALTICTHSNVL